jgi:uncharacterized protein involved in tellurium resistance
MPKITIDFSGILVMDPENIKFVSVQSNGEELVITGTQWLTLDDIMKYEFIIQSLSHAIDDCDEIDSLEIDVDVEDDVEDDVEVEVEDDEEVCTDDIVGIKSQLGFYDQE